MTKKKERFLKEFIGEYVVIITDVHSSVMTSEMEQPEQTTLMSEGYLLDQDDKYYYVGTSPNEANIVIDKNRVVIIQCVPPEKETQSVVVQSPPKNGKFH